MIKPNYIKQMEILNPLLLLKALEYSKITPMEYVIIPRIIFQTQLLETCISGITGNSIICISEIEDLSVMDKTPLILWEDTSLNAICFSINQINPFIRALRENLDKIGKITLHYHKYIVNNNYLSIGKIIKAENKIRIKNSQGSLDWIPILELSDYNNIYKIIKTLLFKWDNSTIVGEPISLKEDDSFNNILKLKTGEGCLPWIPDTNKYQEELKPYILYIGKVMFNINKNDEYIIEIRNNVINEAYDKFMAKITVIKKKSKNYRSIHNYYLMGISMF